MSQKMPIVPYSFSWDFNTATLVAIGIQIVIVIVYLVKTNGKAESAYSLAQKASDRAEDAHNKIALQLAAHSLFRETVAKDYIDRELLREMEDRLMGAIGELRERVDRLIDEKPTRRGT